MEFGKSLPFYNKMGELIQLVVNKNVKRRYKQSAQLHHSTTNLLGLGHKKVFLQLYTRHCSDINTKASTLKVKCEI